MFILLLAALALPPPGSAADVFGPRAETPFRGLAPDPPTLYREDETPHPAPADTPPPGSDRWLAWDKFWHLSASFVSVGAGYHLCTDRFGLDHPPATGVSLGGTFALGLGKELLDRYGHGRRFSWKDMAANAAGIAAGYFVFVHRY